MVMRAIYRIASTTALVLASSLVPAGFAAAQTLPEITVDVMRAVKADPTNVTSPIDVTLTGHVSYADLDLTKSADVATLEKRINDEANVLCERIAKDYPNSTPATADCAKKAAAKALVKAKNVVAAKQPK
jgi:UrcA family protein